MKLGYGGSKACTMTVRHASVRASTESRFSPNGGGNPAPLRPPLNTSPTAAQAGPRHQRSKTTPTAATTTKRRVRPAIPDDVHEPAIARS